MGNSYIGASHSLSIRSLFASKGFFALVWNHYVCEFPPLIEFPFPIHPIGFRDWIYFMVLCYFPPSTLIYRLSSKAAVVRYRYVNFGCNL